VIDGRWCCTESGASFRVAAAGTTEKEEERQQKEGHSHFELSPMPRTEMQINTPAG
jgi:hypothetical protein